MIQVDNKKIAKNTLYMYVRMLVTLVVSLFTTRITFNALGIDNYGIYNIVGSIIVFFTFINSGLTMSTRRYITAELAEGDINSQRNIFSLAIWAHILIAAIILLLGETIGLWAVNSLLNIPDDRGFAANVVYQLSVFSTVLMVMQAPYTAAITANERMNIYAYLSILDVILKLAVAYVVLYTPGDKLIIYAICIFAVGFINIIINRIYCIRSFPMCRYKRPENRVLLKEMFGYMGWSLGGQFADILSKQGVTVLVNMFFNVAANAAMGISNQITQIVNNFITSFQVAFNPQITKLYVSKNHEELNGLVVRTSRYSAYLVLLFILPICCQLANFLGLWLGDYPKYSVEFCILTLIAIYIEAIVAPLWMLLCSDSDIKKYQIIISTVSLCSFLGAWAFLKCGFLPFFVILARIITNLIMLFIRLGLCKEKVTTFPISTWIIRVVLKPLIISAIPLLVFFVIDRAAFVNVFVELVIKAGIVLMVTVMSIFVLGLEKNERLFVFKKLHLMQ